MKRPREEPNVIVGMGGTVMPAYQKPGTLRAFLVFAANISPCEAPREVTLKIRVTRDFGVHKRYSAFVGGRKVQAGRFYATYEAARRAVVSRCREELAAAKDDVKYAMEAFAKAKALPRRQPKAVTP